MGVFVNSYFQPTHACPIQQYEPTAFRIHIFLLFVLAHPAVFNEIFSPGWVR